MEALNVIIGKQAVISGGHIDGLIIDLAEPTYSHSHSSAWSAPPSLRNHIPSLLSFSFSTTLLPRVACGIML